MFRLRAINELKRKKRRKRQKFDVLRIEFDFSYVNRTPNIRAMLETTPVRHRKLITNDGRRFASIFQCALQKNDKIK